MSRLPQYLKTSLSGASRRLPARRHLLDARDINRCGCSSLIYRHAEKTVVVERDQGLNRLKPVFIRHEFARNT